MLWSLCPIAVDVAAQIEERMCTSETKVKIDFCDLEVGLSQ